MNLLLPVSVGLDLDILDASVALRVLLVVKYCSLSLSVISFGASSIFSLQRNCSCLPKDLGKACAHSFCVTSASCERVAILPPTLGFLTSARVASPCFERHKFELEFSTRAPQVSAQRDRLSCSLKSHLISFMHPLQSSCLMSSTTRAASDLD